MPDLLSPKYLFSCQHQIDEIEKLLLSMHETQVITYQMVLAGRNLLVTGEGGAGKSWLINLISQSLPNVAIVACYGRVAHDVNGETIHHFFDIPFDYAIPPDYMPKLTEERIALFRRINILVIEEISTVRADLLDLMDRILRQARGIDLPMGGVQLLLFGDFGQTKPVYCADAINRSLLLLEYHDRLYAFDSHVWPSLKLTQISLQTNVRTADTPYRHCLSKLRLNVNAKEAVDKLNILIAKNTPAPQTTILCATNEAVEKINQSKIATLKSPHVTYKARLMNCSEESAQRYFGAHYRSQITIHLGERVMITANKAGHYFNGDIGTVTGLATNHVTLKLDRGSTVSVYAYTFNMYSYTLDSNTIGGDLPVDGVIVRQSSGTFLQVPLIPAYALTVHRAQGLTLPTVHLDLSSPYFDAGMGYVAISRCTSSKGLSVSRPLSEADFIYDERAIQYTLDIERATQRHRKILHHQYLPDDFHTSIQLQGIGHICPNVIPKLGEADINSMTAKTRLRYLLVYLSAFRPSSLEKLNAFMAKYEVYPHYSYRSNTTKRVSMVFRHDEKFYHYYHLFQEPAELLPKRLGLTDTPSICELNRLNQQSEYNEHAAQLRISTQNSQMGQLLNSVFS